jgi:hypothetical protein
MITCVVDDSSTTNDFSAQLQHYYTNLWTGDRSSATVTGGDVSTSGSAGVQYVQSSLSPAITFTSFDASVNTLHQYYIRANVASDTPFAGCWLFWTRQISPAPATASFSDVQTTNTFFQHIEAIKSAGVTNGCGSGNFCPNDYVTRGQMAAFLARALGLAYRW